MRIVGNKKIEKQARVYAELNFKPNPLFKREFDSIKRDRDSAYSQWAKNANKLLWEFKVAPLNLLLNQLATILNEEKNKVYKEHYKFLKGSQQAKHKFQENRK